MNSPLVSVVIPCYNAERWVAEAIQSCLNQTYTSIEIIVIDDGSKDASVEVLKSFGDQIRWQTGPNRGGCVARNAGARLATGEYLQFLDADDILHPRKIEHQMRGLSDGSITASTCRLIVSSDPANDQFSLPVIKRLKMKGPEFLMNWHLGELNSHINPQHNQKLTFGNSSSWIISRSVFAKTGGWNERLVMCQDSEFFARVAMHSDFVEVNPDAHAYYRIGRPDCVSGGVSRPKAESFFHFCQQAGDLLKETRLEGFQKANLKNYLAFIFRFYPHYPDLIEKAFKVIKETGLPMHAEFPSPKFRFMARLIGVRGTLMLRNYLQR